MLATTKCCRLFSMDAANEWRHRLLARLYSKLRKGHGSSRSHDQDLQSRARVLKFSARRPAMRRTILFSLFALLAVSAANDACAQRRGGATAGAARGGHGFRRARAVSPYGLGYGYLPYDSGYDSSGGYDYEPPPVFLAQQPATLVEAPAPPAAVPTGHSVITEYKWPAAELAASASSTTSETQAFVLVLKDGSTLSALSVFASDDGLHYVDPDERHVRISMSEVDRAATFKLNRARNLNLYLPAAQ
jgi:hypothetical protein